MRKIAWRHIRRGFHQRADSWQSLGPDRKDSHGAEGACGGSEGCCGTGAVLGGVLNTTSAAIFPSSIPTAMITTPETTAGKSFRTRLIRDATAISGAGEYHQRRRRWKNERYGCRNARREIDCRNNRRTKIS
jgi:hypothetical protein